MRWFVFFCLYLFASQAMSDPVGKVVLTINNVTAVSIDGVTRRLNRGAEIYEGERIVTGVNSRVQFRLTDNSMVALEPKSEFSVTEFDYYNDNPQDSAAIFDLIKGGLRTFSGEIGKYNPNDYQLNVSVATIGIRGTNYAAQVCDASCATQSNVSSGATGTVIDGRIAVKTDVEVKSVDQAEYFYANDDTGFISITEFPPDGFRLSAAAAGAGSAEQRKAERIELEKKGVVFLDIMPAETYSSVLDISLDEAEKLIADGFVRTDTGTTYLADAIASPGGSPVPPGGVVVVVTVP